VTQTNDPEVIARSLRRYRPLGAIMRLVGPPPVQRRQPSSTRYPFLVRSIVYQQLAGSAASAIHRRFADGCGGRITPGAVDSLSDDQMASFGLSGAKRAAIRDLTLRIDGGHVRLDRHGRWDDETVMGDLVQVRGIGPWTVQMYLMSSLGRTDVWPTGDLGVRYGWSLLHDMEEMIAPKALEAAGVALSPHRTAVAWYCWEAVAQHRARDS